MDADTADTIAAAAVLIRTVAVTAVLMKTFACDLVPSQLQDYLSNRFSSLFSHFSTDLTITIDEHDGGGNVANAMYKAAETYLSTRITRSIRRIRVSKQQQDDGDDPSEDGLEVAVDRDQEVVDTYCGIRFRWRLVFKESLPRRWRKRNYYTDHAAFEARFFELTMHKKHKEVALKRYLPHVISQAKIIREEAKTLKLYTNDEDAWNAVNLRHPATFATMAMDVELKKEVMEDLTRFVKRKEYYRRVGKAWKRGYLLHGPPGTGKSSLVAAMANFLRFDVYDLELTQVKNNSGLKSLLVGMTNRSILVVEDIDCAEGVGPREKGNVASESEDDKVTLSGLLNFVDGLWSSCGDERVFVFTTNHKDRLDPALLRPGRMDMHIHMSYCTMSGFRVLASNYHYIDDHQLFGEIEALIREVEITPAEIAEELMKSDDADVALQGLIKVLKERKKIKETREAREENGNP